MVAQSLRFFDSPAGVAVGGSGDGEEWRMSWLLY